MSSGVARAPKRARDDAASAASGGSGEADARPAKLPARANDEGQQEQADAAWSKMYAPLPGVMQLETDYTKSVSLPASASSSVVLTAAAAAGSYIPAFVSSLLPAATNFEANFNSKLKDKNLMLDNSVAGKNSNINVGDAAAKLARKRRKKRGIQMMSSNQRKAAGLSQIPKENIKYATFLPLHQLWTAYMHDILDPLNSRGLSTGERVLKADYHGAILTVVKCRSPTHVGQRGILIQETQETFQIVTESNALKVLPKRHTVFSFTVPAITAADPTAATNTPTAMSPVPARQPAPAQIFELYGDHMCFRSYERSSRKFKAKATIQL